MFHSANIITKIKPLLSSHLHLNYLDSFSILRIIPLKIQTKGVEMATITQKDFIKGFRKILEPSKEELFDFMQFLILKNQILENNIGYIT